MSVSGDDAGIGAGGYGASLPQPSGEEFGF